MVIVRNKKRVGYTYELTLKVKGMLLQKISVSFPLAIFVTFIRSTTMYMKSGEWIIREEKKMVRGHIDIPEFSFGELDDLQVW